MLILLKEVSPRALYVFDFVFKERGLDYEITVDVQWFHTCPKPKLNFSDDEIKGALNLHPSRLIFDATIGNFGIGKALFYKEECLTFNEIVDPFAAIFYILSRHEEYETSTFDKFGRFEGKNSVLFRYGWHEKAMCDRWAEDIIAWIEERFGKFERTQIQDVNIVPTFDIDNAFAYKYKGILRTILSDFKDVLFGRRKRLMERRKVQAGFQTDPYDTFQKIENVVSEFEYARIFWLLGDFAKYDKNLSFKNKKHRQLIQRMAQKVTIGIHPSMKSNTYDYYLHNEIERLEEIIKNRVHNSRQHFLYLRFPYTYETLQAQEITDDYSMGYADIAGFRAGTARSFLWFDLKKNEVSKLRVHPFAYMDGTLNEYLKLSPTEAKEKIQALFDEVKNFGGDFVFIWHNETIGDYAHWKGWSDVLDFSLRLK
ncbi:MAG: hypothetical protein RL264_2106 [Bacteroidota bacterium]|jgi:hypothetical protein